MSSIKTHRTLFVFYILVIYIFLQFCWWAYLIFDLNMDTYELKAELEFLKTGVDPGDYHVALRNKLLMVMGESSVFLVLLFIGFYQIRKSYLKEIALANQQRNFLLSITHELNSPLASIKLYLQTMQKRQLPEDKKQQVLENSLQEVDRQSRLINNILLAAKVDDSTYQFTMETLDLTQLLRRICNQQAAHFTHTIVPQLESGIEITSDKSALESIFNNLIENARKYAPKDTTIEVHLKTVAENKVEVQVIDEGPGIPADEHALIFQKFYRVGNEDTRKAKGTGLGLYLVAFFTDSMGGKIRVKSKVDEGTTFIVELPKTYRA